MKAASIIILAVLSFGSLYITGCETSHSSSDKTNILGQHTHEEETTTKNPVTGDVSTDKTVQKSN